MPKLYKFRDEAEEVFTALYVFSSGTFALVIMTYKQKNPYGTWSVQKESFFFRCSVLRGAGDKPGEFGFY